MGAAVVSTITSIFCTGTKTNCTEVQIELQHIYIYTNISQEEEINTICKA